MKHKDSWIEKFVSDALPLIKNRLKTDRVLIFGSRATGTAKNDSDLDIIILSDAFKDIPFIRRMPFVLNLLKFQKHIDALCYTESEFEKIKNESTIVQDALKNGYYLN